MYLEFEDVLEEATEVAAIQKHPEAVEEFLEHLMNDLEELDAKLYEKYTIKFHKLVHDKKFSRNLAEYAVHHLENKDPKHPKGGYWDWEETENIAQQHGIKGNTADTYYVLNAMRSDYFDPALPADEVEYYAKIAKDFLEDKDAREGKALCYWMYVTKGY